jgi:integral membrane protein
MESYSDLSATMLGKFRLVAFFEGCSYLLLGLTMILKYRFAMPGPNYVVGMIHGLLFILYVILLFLVWRKYEWSLKKTFFAFIASLVPFGTFIADKRIYRN